MTLAPTTKRFLAAAGITLPLTAVAPQFDPNLPQCPLCNAPALAGQPYARYNSLTHNCDCDLDRPDYDAALRRLWNARRALPDLLACLPARFHSAHADQFAGDPFASALCATTTSGYIYGPAGVGKSHLAAAAGLAAARRGVRVAYWPFNKLLEAARATAAGERERLDLTLYGLVLVEDLGKFKATDFAYEVLYGLAEERWARGLATIYTANHDALTVARAAIPTGMLPTAEDREAGARALASRFEAGIVYHASGEDRRVQGL